MTILSQENPVILLLENMLEALSTAPDNINNERRRRRYLLNWLDTARQCFIVSFIQIYFIH